jgi:thiamine-phosphate pyrophosphorylase
VGADGVHLPSDDVSPSELVTAWTKCSAWMLRTAQPQLPYIGVSCHSPTEVTQAAAKGADFAVFAPVFEKKDAPNTQPTGLAVLKEACRVKIPVLALGGVTLSNAQSCLDAGAAGIAAIRLFQDNDIDKIVHTLRS